MSELPEQPFIIKSASEILSELQEHVIAGIVAISYEEYIFTSGTSTYELLCGSPGLADGQLMEVNRLWSTSDGSFHEFVENIDFTVDLSNNEITFITEPDDDAAFFVSYKYDQKFESGITDTSEGSVTRVLLQSFTRQISACWESLGLIKAAAYIDTAQGNDLDELLKLVGVERNEATGASGYVTFYRDGSGGQPIIPIGSRVSALRADGSIIYETTEESLFLEGFSSARAPVQAVDAYVGRNSNMGPNRITRLLSDAGGSSRCDNPQYYSDYEIHSLLEGKYTYQLDHSPRRVINTEGFQGNTSPPWAETDKGIVAIWGYRDISMDTASWSSSNISAWSEDPTGSGQLKIKASTDVDAYISTTYNLNHATYPQLYVMARGTEGDEFNVDVVIESTTYNVELYEFGSTSSTTQALANLNWTLYVGSPWRPIEDCLDRQNSDSGLETAEGSRYIVGPAGADGFAGKSESVAEIVSATWSFTAASTDNIVHLSGSSTTYNEYRWTGSLWTGVQITTSTASFVCKSTNPFWIDFVAVGHELDEIQGVTMTNADQVSVNYTARVMGLWYSTANSNFFKKYDGDDSDSKIDYLFSYYQWNNNISGGGDEEVDDALRVRGRGALHVAAKGTKDAIRNSVLAIDGISQCEVVDYNDDTTIENGVCHVYVLARGFVVSPSLNADIVAAIDDTRAAGIFAKVFSPQVRYVNFTLNVIYDDALPDYAGDTGQATLRAIVSSTLDDFFADASINQALYFSDLMGYIIREVTGVAAAYVTWDGATTPTISDDDFEGSYAWDEDIVLDTPRRIYGQKEEVTIVVQRGSGITTSSINLLRKSENQ